MMDKNLMNSQASSDFNRAKSRALFNTIMNILKPERRQLLSFYDVKSLIKTSSESYRGMQAVNIDQIAGSEGRYSDFNKAFFPKKEHLRKRWESIDKAYMGDVNLPPIMLYKIGDLYFVRDGNHRVSVAKAQGVYSIDAEVTELSTEMELTSKMDMMDLKRTVIEYERNLILKQTDLDGIIEEGEIFFTAPGRYEEMLQHILGHKYFINMNQEEEILLPVAARSWYENLYTPIVKVIRDSNLLSRFPGRTEADLYIWIVKQWHYMKEKYGPEYPLEAAAAKYTQEFGYSFFKNPLKWLQQKFNPVE
ncbi:transcriptional regulator [Oceanispirochaeta crateris]|uniref:Transcriptional regulator n=1 Tax=Oceanispirochaeta crateris TaxID=2518645 RepID=A0A5C1QND0_9SPIO|nr:transcriptional regulator [Oceanispirochaeta crateris]QEN08064.1 transcriptional regulator [Oceanispirochaeta crateris]